MLVFIKYGCIFIKYILYTLKFIIDGTFEFTQWYETES